MIDNENRNQNNAQGSSFDTEKEDLMGSKDIAEEISDSSDSVSNKEDTEETVSADYAAHPQTSESEGTGGCEEAPSESGETQTEDKSSRFSYTEPTGERRLMRSEDVFPESRRSFLRRGYPLNTRELTLQMIEKHKNAYRDETYAPSSARRVWLGVLSAALCLIAGFFGAAFGIYSLAQTGFVDSNSMLGNMIIDASGAEINKVTMNETSVSYTGGFIEASEKALTVTVALTELIEDSNGGYTEKGYASGVIIDPSGYVVTNQHVTTGLQRLKAELSDGRVYYANVIDEDEVTDIAVIKLELPEGVTLPAATLGVSADVKYGQSVLAVGNPLGVGLTVSNGIVSCPLREVNTSGEKNHLIQTNAEVSPGNSGGGMFDAYGNLIGVVCSKMAGDKVEGIGYAVPIDTVKTVVNDLLKHGYVKGRAALGITIASIFDYNTYDYYKNGDLSDVLHGYESGLYVAGITRDIGVKRGDLMLKIDGKELKNVEVVKDILREHKPGDVITLTVKRVDTVNEEGCTYKLHDIKITLAERDW